MEQKKKMRLFILGLLGIFLMGISLPAMANTTGQGQALKEKIGQMGKGLGGIFAQHGKDCIQIAADLTGQEPQAVIEARQQGKSLVDIVKEKDVDEDTLVNKIMDEEKAALKSRLDDGKITQEQYDACLADMETRIKKMVESTDAIPQGPGKGGPRGFGRYSLE